MSYDLCFLDTIFFNFTLLLPKFFFFFYFSLRSLIYMELFCVWCEVGT